MSITPAYMTNKGWIVEFRAGYWWSLSPDGDESLWLPTCHVSYSCSFNCDYVLVVFESTELQGFSERETEALTEAYQNLEPLDELISQLKVKGLPGFNS
jgi:hypothetical protein